MPAHPRDELSTANARLSTSLGQSLSGGVFTNVDSKIARAASTAAQNNKNTKEGARHQL